MTRKERKQLRDRETTRQLMGIRGITERGLQTPRGELAFFLLQPVNLSVLSEEDIRGRVEALTDLLKGMEEAELLILDSRESFQPNKDWYRERMEAEELPQLRALLARDAVHLDDIQLTTAAARAFALVVRLRSREDRDAGAWLADLEKTIRSHGFQVRRAGEQDLMRLLAVYYEQNITTEPFYYMEGEEFLDHG